MRTIVTACLIVLAVACGDDDDDDGEESYDELDLAVCAAAGTFTLEIDNPYFPLPVGHRLVLEGDEDGTELRVEITVLDETEEVAGVTTRVIEEAEYEDGEVVEISRNFFAQAADGTVCYFGETVDEYEGGEVASHHGEWRAGQDDAEPGIVMPGNPRVGTMFFQENAPGVAQDKSAIAALDEPVSVPAGDFDALRAIDWNPLEGESLTGGETKYYVEGIGLVVDEAARLVEHTPID